MSATIKNGQSMLITRQPSCVMSAAAPARWNGLFEQ
jgi:hypothetical protein